EGTKRARSAGANPAAPALVTLLLLAEALLEEAAQFVHVERLQGALLLLAEENEAGGVAKPLFDFLDELDGRDLDAAEVGGEGLVEGVEVGFTVHEERASHVVEAVERVLVQAHREGFGRGE